MVWCLALCPNDTKQDPLGYGAEFGVVFATKCSRPASIKECFGFLGLNHSYREGVRYFRLVAELTQIPLDAHPSWAGPPGDFNGHVRGFSHRAPWASKKFQLFVTFSGRYDSQHRSRFTRWRHAQDVCLLRRHD